MLQKIAKVFTNGKNKAVRLPKDFGFERVNEVVIRKEGKSLVITPLRKDWISFADLPAADEDFMADRTELFDGERIQF